MEYDMVIGIEIHVELSTNSKIFCGCTTAFGGEPNTHCCPICTGMPGTLPVLNEKAVDYAIKAGLALNCDISQWSKMDRKNYFYPDLPKAYQVSQFDFPLCKEGHVDIEGKTIGIERIHLEEDAGKLVHDQHTDMSVVDYNRCGVPLIEIVSRPDMTSSEQARAYVEKVRQILQYIDVSDCKMQEGSLRADINLSVKPKNQKKLGTRTEMKNLNSFKSIVQAIESESKRQIKVLSEGSVIVQETRRWDDEKGKSFSMRSKEDAHDYRYFPEPDLLPIFVDQERIQRIKSDMPILAHERKERYMKTYGLSVYDVDVLISERILADFFDEAIKAGGDPKTIANWMMGDLMRLRNQRDDGSIPIKAKDLVMLLQRIDEKVISQNIGKKVLEIMFETEKTPDDIIEEKGLKTVKDDDFLQKIVQNVIKENEKSVQDYLDGKEKALGFLMGQVMKQTKGKADPQITSKFLKEKLDPLK